MRTSKLVSIVALLLCVVMGTAAKCPKKNTDKQGGSGAKEQPRSEGDPVTPCTRDCRGILLTFEGKGNRLGNKGYIHVVAHETDTGKTRRVRPLSAIDLPHIETVTYSRDVRLTISASIQGYGSNQVRVTAFRYPKGGNELCGNRGFSEEQECHLVLGE